MLITQRKHMKERSSKVLKNDFGKCSFLVLSAKAMDEKIKTWTLCFPAKENPYVEKAMSGCKENHFTAHHWGKMKLEFTSPDVISTSPRHFLTSRIDFIVLLLFELLKKHHLPIGQVNNRIH